MEQQSRGAQRRRSVHLRPRLQMALGLVGRVDTAADIGCDHGRLSVAMLQSGAARRVIATDISAESLQKAAALCAHVGLMQRMELRVGDGLLAISLGEADAIVMCGMGGGLIAGILDAASPPLMGAQHAVLQPMRGVEQLREYLFTHGYRIDADRIVWDNGRYYQILAISIGESEALPKGWPEGFFAIGPGSCGETLFEPLAQHMLRQCTLRLSSAAGTRGEEALLNKQRALRQILQLWHR